MTVRKLTAGAALLCAAILLCAAPAPGGEGDVRKQARDLLEKHKDALVLVEVVLKIKITRGGQSQDGERKIEVNGTVIRSDGLTVISNSSINPGEAYKRMGIKVDTSTSGVKIITADGTEHEARVALTDKDLDLAFILPEKKVEMPCIEMKKAAQPGLLDNMISLTRMGRKANREPGAALSRVQSVITKPRVRYVPAGQVYLACPAFSEAGEALGLALQWPDAGNAMIVLPCEDVQEAAGQVKAGEARTGEGDATTKTAPTPAPAVDPLEPPGL